MSSTASVRPWSLPSSGVAGADDSGAAWPLVGSFVLHLAAAAALTGLWGLPASEPLEAAYHVSLVTLSAPALSEPAARPQRPPASSNPPPLPDVESPLRETPPPVEPVTPSGPEAPRMAETLTQTIQSVRIPAITKPSSVDGVSVVPQEVTPPSPAPPPPPLASVRLDREPPPPFSPAESRAGRDKRASDIANLAIPALVSSLTVRRPDLIPHARLKKPVAPAASSAPSASTGESPSSSVETSYQESIRTGVHRQWLVSEMRYLAPLRVVLAFRVERTGEVKHLVVHRSSGSHEYDVMAERAVLAASPFPAFPPAITDPYLEINFTFNFQLAQ